MYKKEGDDLFRIVTELENLLGRYYNNAENTGK